MIVLVDAVYFRPEQGYEWHKRPGTKQSSIHSQPDHATGPRIQTSFPIWVGIRFSMLIRMSSRQLPHFLSEHCYQSVSLTIRVLVPWK